ncbi:M20 peptidase aminoacylase family protein [Bacillus luteolus]|uniref:M20 peptidase aminoacylase family protein n=1 Tax=Litchfieldia luteola TaxID=682179 RepID=A0ABR9QL84_9BACI|nr:M20 peptidase aminoacylase family protein [Cytobacillus luteolus]MBE4909259.1 M20 peptidase aminoacylase family protein [Cytobacillus luteolus]MBP1940284.1 amidohydrolase [Cytobacillus luteolus]
MIHAIKDWVMKNEESIKSTYHHLHTNAEISWKEVETTKFLCSKLEQLGITYKTFNNHTGVVGYWGNKEDGPKIGIRSDIDALWQLVDGEWKANHSCGHDGHMTMVLHAITCLKEIGFEPKGLIKIIFQPAEESGNGAKAIIETGVVAGLDYLMGIHVRPIQEMPFGVASPAIYHGATTLLKGEVKGIQAHGSRPNLGINVADSIAAIIQAVNSIKIDPTVSASAKVTMVKAGGNNLNIIPDFAEFGIDVRAENNTVMTDLLEKVRHATITAGLINYAKVNLEPQASMVAAEPSPEIEEVVKEAIVEAIGEEGLVPAPVTPGGEDFHFYKQTYPNLQATMVGLGTGLSPGLHHPNMSFNLNALLNGVKILSLSLVKVMEQKE